jgi:SAM-dependent methyltransferase
MSRDNGMNPAEFDNIAAAERQFWWYRGMRRVLYRLLDPVASRRSISRVLEVGCGTGYFARELEARYRWRVVALDLGFEGLAHGRRLGIGNLVQADMRALPCAAASFDAVVSMDVIVHLPRGQEGLVLAEFTRVLKPGGLLALRVSALDILRSRHSEFAHERQRFTRSRLLGQVRRNGLRPLRSTYANSLLLPVALAKFRIWEPLTRQAPSSGVRPVAPWLDRLLYSALAAESAWLGAGLNFPIGQSIVLLAEKPA